MYNVSNDYITAVRANTRRDNLFGTITFSDGTTQQITDRDIGEGSVSIHWQCVDGEELEFGSAILTELNIDIRTEQSRYAFYGAKISLTYSVKTGIDDDDQEIWYDLPLGIYNVSEATRVGTLVSIQAYDNLQKLDMQYGDSTTIVGTPYELLEEICDRTGLELGISTDDIADWPNIEQTLQIDSSTGCNTYREVVKVICQMICAFASVDREGRLVVKQFHKNVDTVLTKSDRYSSSVADYICTYSGVSVTGISGTYEAVSKSVKDGLLLIMDDAPAWDYGIEDVLQNRVDTILEYLETLSYSPCDVSMPGDPSIECGDRITLTYDDEEIDTIITGVSWTYRNSMNLESIGKNPYFSTSTGTAQSTNRILTQTGENNKLVLYTYTNIKDEIIGSGLTSQICNFRFASTGKTTVLFYATITFEVIPDSQSKYEIVTNASFKDDSGNIVPIIGTLNYTDITITYELTDVVLEYKPKYRYQEGIHTVTLFFPIEDIDAQSVNFWNVSMTTSGGQVKILEHDLKAVLCGQNLIATVPWDGRLDLNDVVGRTAQIQNIRALKDVVSEPSFRKITPTAKSYTDSVGNKVTVGQISTIENTAIDCTFDIE